jgi:hypothetical protein
MSNSPLVCYTKISPHKSSPRKDKIKKITIHHMAGNLTIERCGSVFQTREASANYGIGSDGRIGMYVEEKDRAWSSSNEDNDNHAITIEVANDGDDDADWHVSDKALESLISLCVDICKRNDIKRLDFTGNKNGNLTMHCYFAPTICPGPYLKSKFPWIAEEVNKILNKPTVQTSYNIGLQVGDVVKLTSNAKYKSGEAVPKWVINSELYIRELQGDNVVISTLKTGPITGAVNKKYVTKNGKSVTNISKKSITEIAIEVIQGKWDNGEARKRKLIAAGYNYNEVQKKVNELL